MLGGIHNYRSRYIIAKRVTSCHISNFLVTQNKLRTILLTEEQEHCTYPKLYHWFGHSFPSRVMKWIPHRPRWQATRWKCNSTPHTPPEFLLVSAQCSPSAVLVDLGLGCQRGLSRYWLRISLHTVYTRMGVPFILNRLRISCVRQIWKWLLYRLISVQ